MVLTQFHWEFNGHFQHCITSNVTYEFHWNGDEGLDISNFRLVPYDHVGTTAQSMLQERGEMIWRCRYMKFVSYSGYEALGVEWFVCASSTKVGCLLMFKLDRPMLVSSLTVTHFDAVSLGRRLPVKVPMRE